MAFLREVFYIFLICTCLFSNRSALFMVIYFFLICPTFSTLICGKDWNVEWNSRTSNNVDRIRLIESWQIKIVQEFVQFFLGLSFHRINEHKYYLEAMISN